MTPEPARCGSRIHSKSKGRVCDWRGGGVALEVQQPGEELPLARGCIAAGIFNFFWWHVEDRQLGEAG